MSKGNITSKRAEIFPLHFRHDAKQIPDSATILIFHFYPSMSLLTKILKNQSLKIDMIFMRKSDYEKFYKIYFRPKEVPFTNPLILEIDDIHVAVAYNSKRGRPSVSNSDKKKIKDLRESGLSYRKIAEKIGLSKSTVSKYIEKE